MRSRSYLCFMSNRKDSSRAPLISAHQWWWWFTGRLAQWNCGHATEGIMVAIADSVLREWWLGRRGHGWLVQLEECGRQQGLSGQRQRRLRCWGQTLIDWTYLETIDKKKYSLHSFCRYIITMTTIGKIRNIFHNALNGTDEVLQHYLGSTGSLHRKFFSLTSWPTVSSLGILTSNALSSLPAAVLVIIKLLSIVINNSSKTT